MICDFMKKDEIIPELMTLYRCFPTSTNYEKLEYYCVRLNDLKLDLTFLKPTLINFVNYWVENKANFPSYSDLYIYIQARR